MRKPLRLATLALCVTGLVSGCGDDGAGPSGDTEDATESVGPATETETPDPSVGAESSTGEVPGTTGDEDETTTGEASTGSEDSTGANAECYAPMEECSQNEFEPFECGSTPVCDTLEVNDPSLNEFDEEPFGFMNPEAATCILEGLRDGTPGTYRIETEPGQQYSRDLTLEVLSDGSVIENLAEWEDKCLDQSGSWAPLNDAAVFQACLDSGDEAMMLDCMASAGDVGSCIEGPTVCP